MATATVKGETWQVRVTQDLTDNWAVELYPEPPKGTRKVSEPYKPWPTPLVMKVFAKTQAHALVCALEHLKTLGRIEGFELAPGEAPPPKPEPVAKPAAPAATAPAATE